MNLSARVLAAKMPFHRFDNLAAALQDFTEEVVVEWVKQSHSKDWYKYNLHGRRLIHECESEQKTSGDG